MAIRCEVCGRDSMMHVNGTAGIYRCEYCGSQVWVRGMDAQRDPVVRIGSGRTTRKSTASDDGDHRRKFHNLMNRADTLLKYVETNQKDIRKHADCVHKLTEANRLMDQAEVIQKYLQLKDRRV